MSRDSYGCRFKAMISDWRHRFSTDGRSNSSAPFLFVQLAPYHGDRQYGFGGTPCMIEGGDAAGTDYTVTPGIPPPPTFGGGLPQQRLVQLEALELQSVGMACTVDLGDAASPYWPGSVHPRHKQPVAARLLLEARRIAYGEADLVSRGPQVSHIEQLPTDAPGGSYHSKAVEIIRVHWSSVGGGLTVVPGGGPSVAFVATLNNSMTVPGTIMPTNLTRSSCDVYFNKGYNWPLANCTSCVPYVETVAFLPFDFPVAPLFSKEGLPAEPFVRNLTAG